MGTEDWQRKSCCIVEKEIIRMLIDEFIRILFKECLVTVFKSFYFLFFTAEEINEYFFGLERLVLHLWNWRYDRLIKKTTRTGPVPLNWLWMSKSSNRTKSSSHFSSKHLKTGQAGGEWLNKGFMPMKPSKWPELSLLVFKVLAVLNHFDLSSPFFCYSAWGSHSFH